MDKKNKKISNKNIKKKQILNDSFEEENKIGELEKDNKASTLNDDSKGTKIDKNSSKNLIEKNLSLADQDFLEAIKCIDSLISKITCDNRIYLFFSKLENDIIKFTIYESEKIWIKKFSKLDFEEFVAFMTLFFASKHNLAKRIECFLKSRNFKKNCFLTSEQAYEKVEFLFRFYNVIHNNENMELIHRLFKFDNDVKFDNFISHIYPFLKSRMFVKW